MAAETGISRAIGEGGRVKCVGAASPFGSAPWMCHPVPQPGRAAPGRLRGRGSLDHDPDRRRARPCPLSYLRPALGSGPQPLHAHALRFALARHPGADPPPHAPILLPHAGLHAAHLHRAAAATVQPYGRKTLRLEEALQLLGLFLGGEAGTRLARELGILTSPDTLLRRARQPPSRSMHAALPRRRRLGVAKGPALRHAPLRPGEREDRGPPARENGRVPRAVAPGSPRCRGHQPGSGRHLRRGCPPGCTRGRAGGRSFPPLPQSHRRAPEDSRTGACAAAARTEESC